MRRLPARRLVLATTALAVAAGAHALAASPATPDGPLVAADGHGLMPRFASLADTQRVARRTAQDDVADTLSHWGARESQSEPTPDGTLVGRLGLNMATFWSPVPMPVVVPFSLRRAPLSNGILLPSLLSMPWK